MAVTHTYGKVSVKYNELSSIIIETKSEDGYIWNEVTFKEDNEQKEIYIGSFYDYNYGNSSEWMEYNEKYIALLKISKAGYENSDVQVEKIFDTNKKQLIQGTKEELLQIYNKEFKGIDISKILTKNK